MDTKWALKLELGSVYCQIRSGDLREDEFEEWMQIVVDDIYNNGGIHTIFKAVREEA